MSLRSNEKLQGVQSKAPAGPWPLTQSSEAGGADELHELAVAHVPQQALQAALTCKTGGAQARASSCAHARCHGPGPAPTSAAPKCVASVSRHEPAQ